MFRKKKIGVISSVVVSFLVGGFVFNAYNAGAFGGNRMFGFFGGGCDLSGLEKGSTEWQAKMEECRAEREVQMEERKAQLEEFKAMTPEERQVKLEELEENWPENRDWRGRGFKFGQFIGFRGFEILSDQVNYEIVNLSNGVQITITSDNADIVTKLQENATRLNK